MPIDGLGDAVAVTRKARGLTQAELAQAIGVTQTTVNRYEAGERAPDDATIAALAGALGVTERLLRRGGRFSGALAVDTHMRRQRTTKASVWRRMEARLNMLRMHASFLFEEVSMVAQQQVPTFDADFTRPEDAARLVRAQWRMAVGPVTNLTRWLEAAGCLVFEEDFGTRRVDGLSQWVGDHPVILLNVDAAPDRKRLTVAHELGHLVLHSSEPNEDMENQASAFAAEFLMPEVVIKPELRHLSLGGLVDLKREWGVSIHALLERAYGLGLLTATGRASYYKSLNARGWRANEPGSDSLPMERPALAAHIADSLRVKGFTAEQIAEAAGYTAVQDNPFRPAQPHLSVVGRG